MSLNMVDIAQLVELQIVVLAVAGSSPVIHPSTLPFTMKIQNPKKEIKIYLNSLDKIGDRQMYRVLVDKFIAISVTGCTIVRSNSGYGMNMQVKFLDDSLISNLWSKDSTIIITIIETEAKIEEIIKILDEFMDEGIVTIKDVDFIRYTKSSGTSEDIDLAKQIQ
jgi:uncharacterized protein